MDVEQRARELLAKVHAAAGWTGLANEIRLNATFDIDHGLALAAIRVALTPPEGYEKALRDATRYNYLRSRLLDTCMFNDAGELIYCDERNGPELDALIDSEIDGRKEVPDGRG